MRSHYCDVSSSTQLPSILHEATSKAPDYVMERNMVQRQGKAATMVLVKWINRSEEEAIWEFLFDMTKKYPDVSL